MKSILTAVLCTSLCACGAGADQASVKESPSYSSWAMPSISTAHIRTEPRHGSEMSSQALMGTPLKLTAKTDNGWCRIETPEGYTGYINGNTLAELDGAGFDEWRKAPRVIVTSVNEVKAYSDTSDFTVMSDLVPGCIIAGRKEPGDGFVAVALPDRRTGFVEARHLTDLDEWADSRPSAEAIIDLAMNQTGAPYLWGGLSSKGMDCSGLTKMAYYRCGIILPRDASQQAACGTPVPLDSLQKGDLLFFGNVATGRVNHVGIYDTDGYFIEAAGRVRRSLLADNQNFLYARRIIGADSIATARLHPWYFINKGPK